MLHVIQPIETNKRQCLGNNNKHVVVEQRMGSIYHLDNNSVSASTVNMFVSVGGFPSGDIVIHKGSYR